MSKNNKKGVNITLVNRAAALFVAANMFFTGLGEVFAEDIPVQHIPGEFITAEIPSSEEDETFEVYNEYTVEHGDSLARISNKICDFYGIERTEKYWPVLAYLNQTSPTIYEGESIFFPTSVERMDEIRDELISTKWLANYITTYDVYGEASRNNNGSGRNNNGNGDFTVKYGTTTIRELVRSEYGIDDDYFVQLFIKAHGLSQELTADSVIFNNDVHWLLGETLYTASEVAEFANKEEPVINWDLLEQEGELKQETLDYFAQQRENNGLRK